MRIKPRGVPMNMYPGFIALQFHIPTVLTFPILWGNKFEGGKNE